jgi:hypothetical protein
MFANMIVVRAVILKTKKFAMLFAVYRIMRFVVCSVVHLLPEGIYGIPGTVFEIRTWYLGQI